jgi:Serine phosphatase RsbU, regulator of sigma subunit
LNKNTRQCTHIKADGLFLGIFPDMMLKETCYSYQTGIERFVLYTDGLTEAKNNAEEMYDLSHLEQAALASIDNSPALAIEYILNDQKTFCGADQAPEDDITLLVIDL